jgi:hypothetical protein
MLAPRIKYAVLTALLIGAGLLTRGAIPGLPAAIAKYCGAVIWGGMIYAAMACLMPKQSVVRTAIAAALVTTGVELSQLWHTGTLDAFRRTTIGVLLIGRFFSWWDVVSYLIGIAAVAVFDKFVLRTATSQPR